MAIAVKLSQKLYYFGTFAYKFLVNVTLDYKGNVAQRNEVPYIQLNHNTLFFVYGTALPSTDTNPYDVVNSIWGKIAVLMLAYVL